MSTFDSRALQKSPITLSRFVPAPTLRFSARLLTTSFKTKNLKTYTDEGEENIYLRDWTTLHLDLLAEEKKLRKCGAVELE